MQCLGYFPLGFYVRWEMKNLNEAKRLCSWRRNAQRTRENAQKRERVTNHTVKIGGARVVRAEFGVRSKLDQGTVRGLFVSVETVVPPDNNECLSFKMF